MADVIRNKGNANIVLAICDAIHGTKDMLSEIDGAIGDGDHGVNMNKGFTLAKGRITEDDSLSDALATLGDTLVDDIGGSMGPIYGTLFLTLSDSLDVNEIDAKTFGSALSDAAEALMDLTDARPGDKTLVDTIVPACKAYNAVIGGGGNFGDALSAMDDGAEKGWQSTRDMQAKLGRAARLGERSIGHLDAGATSCHIVLHTLAEGIKAKLVG